MTERFDFYHLHERSVPLEIALARLAFKAYSGGARSLIKVGSKERLSALDASLWTFDAGAWLPHGASAEDYPGDQPVFLTLQDENPNGAKLLFLLDGAWIENSGDFDRVFVLFDERDEIALGAARMRWKTLKDGGFPLYYWQQNERGRWEEKHRANVSETES